MAPDQASTPEATVPGPALRIKPLGGSTLEVPIVCLGTMTFGKQNSEEESFALLDYAFERGVNFLDTAELYPVPPSPATSADTERIIGRWMKARSIPRDKIIITTKVAGEIPGLDRSFIVAARSETPAEAASQPQPKLRAAEIRDACEASLRRLQTDYIDIYLIHWPARYAPCFGKRRYRPELERESPSVEEQVEAIGQLIQEGKIKEWGVSNETTFGVCTICEAARKLGVKPPVAIQNDVSLVLRSYEGELAEACAPRNNNIGLLAYGCLAGGTLTGKYRGGVRPEKSRHTIFPGFQPRYLSDRVAAATERYAELAESKGLTPTQLALSWAATRWYMASVIIGGTTVQQLKDNIDACCLALDPEVEAAVDELYLTFGDANLTD
ncbi:Protein tas [Monoraphidium neglectum]|uniref:Protein tas n=1 Tax=Monoraphidium neglectum TaxID=145388 RepID=A0A0D2KC16_9CHLO|nr:Protein tas [Monoraphidium neglectum]KIZ07628.1 Protein tas [Monoraphidium neglectum]|eukprot:XP_013906647.1 Protein tas [Monoraphidium neglectum]